jgi:hypothetical protein
MGVFGETDEERQLKRDLEAKTEELATATGAHDRTRDLMAIQERGLRRLEAVHRITDVADVALRQAETSGHVQVSAEETAKEVVKKRYVGHAEGTIADRIITEQADAIRMERGPEWDQEIEQRLREQYDKDGTFDRIERETDAKDIGVIGQRLQDETAQEREDFNNTPGRQEELLQQERSRLQEQGILDDIRAAKDEEANRMWRDQAYQEALQEIDDEIERTREDRIRHFKEEWKDSHEGKNRRRYTTETLERKWRSMSDEEVAQETDDEVTRELREGKNQRNKEQLEREKFYADYLEAFTQNGIDMTIIPEKCVVTIELGSKKDDEQRDSYGYKSKSGQKTIDAKRTLIVTSLGGGRYRLESDTLGLSNNVHEKKDAIPVGMTIHLGRESHETKDGKTKTTLDESMREGVPGFYDDDRTDPAISALEYPVANIRINGVSAVKNLAEDKK